MKYFLLLLFLQLILVSCHKEESQSVNYLYIDSRLLSQEFKTGSYWIYKNDSTSKTDCTFIFNARKDYYTYFEGMGITSDIYFYDIFYYYTNTVNGQPYDRDRIERTLIMRNPVRTIGNMQLGPALYYADSIKNDSLKVGSNMFYQVQKARVDNTDFYTAKSVGLVKHI